MKCTRDPLTDPDSFWGEICREFPLEEAVAKPGTEVGDLTLIRIFAFSATLSWLIYF